MFYYVILEKRSYTREDMRLHTIISYVLLVIRIIYYYSTGTVVTILGRKTYRKYSKSVKIFFCLKMPPDVELFTDSIIPVNLLVLSKHNAMH